MKELLLRNFPDYESFLDFVSEEHDICDYISMRLIIFFGEKALENAKAGDVEGMITNSAKADDFKQYLEAVHEGE